MISSDTLSALATADTYQCTWISASNFLITNFTDVGTFTLQTNFSINGGVLRASSPTLINPLPASTTATPASCVQITAPASLFALYPVKPVLIVPSEVSGYGITSVDGSSSQGALGRPWQAVAWYYEVIPDGSNAQASSPVLFATSLVASLMPPCNCTLNVTLVLENWLGDYSTSSQQISVLPYPLVPNLIISNGTQIVVNRTTSIQSNNGIITIEASHSNTTLFNITTWNVTTVIVGDLYKDTPWLQPAPQFNLNGSTLLINATSLIPGSTYLIVRTVCTVVPIAICFSSTSTLSIPSTAIPVLQYARLSDSVNEIDLQFTSGTNQRDAPAQLPCNLIVLPATLAALGVPPTSQRDKQCTWRSNSLLVLTLGQGFSLSPGNLIQLNNAPVGTSGVGLLRSADGYSFPVSTLVSPLALPLSPPRPVAVISGVPQFLGFCQNFKANSILSTGNAGRPFSVLWSIPSARDQSIAASIWAALQLQRNQSSFYIPQAVVAQDLQRLLNSGASSATFTLQLTVKNWLLASNSVSLAIQLATLPMAEISLDGPSIQTTDVSAFFRSTALATPLDPSCVGPFVDSPSDFDPTALGLSYTWSEALNDAQLVLTAPSKGSTLSFSPFTLAPPPASYNLIASAIINYNGQGISTNTISLQLSTLPGVPVAQIYGSTKQLVSLSTDPSQTFELDASASYHSSFSSCPFSTSDPVCYLEAVWECNLVLPAANVRALLSAAALAEGNYAHPPCFPASLQSTLGLGAATANPLLSFPASYLSVNEPNDAYNFSVTVSSPNNPGNASVAYVLVTVVKESIPVVSVSWQKNPSDILWGMAQAGMKLRIGGFASFPPLDSSLAYLWTVSPPVVDLSDPLIRGTPSDSPNLMIFEDTLPYNMQLTFSLLVWVPSEPLNFSGSAKCCSY